MKSKSNKTMKNNMFLSNFCFFSIILIIPLVICNVWFILYSRSTMEEMVSYIATENVGRMQEVFEAIVEEASLLTMAIAISDSVTRYSYKNFEYGDILKIQSDIQSYLYVNKYLHSIYLVDKDGKMAVSQKEFYQLDDDAEELRMINSSDFNQEDKVVFYPFLYKNIYPQLLGLAFRMGTWHTNSYVIVNIDLTQINATLASSSNEVEYSYILLGDIIIYSTKLEDDFKNNIKEIPWINALIMSDTVPGSNVAYRKSFNNDFSYITQVLPVTGNSMWHDFTRSMIVLIIICACFSALIAVIFSHRSIYPIKKILGAFDDNNHLNTWLEDSSVSNEVRMLINNILETRSSNRQMFKELNSRLYLLRQAQVAALYAQINPHFINNTLDSINWLVFEEIGENSTITSAISNLSSLLKICFEVDNIAHSMNDEINHIKLYCNLIELRYPNKLEVSYEIDDDLLEIIMPKFILQPIIENAIYHGIKNKIGKGEITIRAKKMAHQLTIQIEDDGIGIKAQDLKTLNEKIVSSFKYTSEYFEKLLDESETELMMPTYNKSKGLGLINVAERIKLICGEDYGIELESEYGKGTTVTLCLKVR